MVSINVFEMFSIKKFFVVARQIFNKEKGVFESFKDIKQMVYIDDKNNFRTQYLQYKYLYQIQEYKNPKKLQGHLITDWYKLVAIESETGKEFNIDNDRMIKYYQDRIYLEHSVPENQLTVDAFWSFNPFAADPRPGYGWDYDCSWVTPLPPNGYTLCNTSDSDWDYAITSLYEYTKDRKKVMYELGQKTGLTFTNIEYNGNWGKCARTGEILSKDYPESTIPIPQTIPKVVEKFDKKAKPFIDAGYNITQVKRHPRGNGDYLGYVFDGVEYAIAIGYSSTKEQIAKLERLTKRHHSLVKKLYNILTEKYGKDIWVMSGGGAQIQAFYGDENGYIGILYLDMENEKENYILAEHMGVENPDTDFTFVSERRKDEAYFQELKKTIKNIQIRTVVEIYGDSI